MLPFPKRTATGEEVELTDDDLVLVEEIAPRGAAIQPFSASVSSHSHVRAASPRAAHADADRVARAPRGAALPPGSRRVLDEQVEEDVAGQCLASIAAATSLESPRHLSSSSQLRAALAAAPVAAPPSSSPSSESRVSRLPFVSAPPFVRTMTTTYPLSGEAASPRTHAPEAPGIRDSAPPAAFIRRSTPALGYPVSSATLPPAAPSSFGALAAAAPSQSAFGSVAPVSMATLPPAAPEPTVIVVRERPRSIWIVAAAAVGAVAAVAAMRFAPAASGERPTSAEPAAAAQPAAALPLPSTAVVLPVATSTPVAAVPVAATAPAASVAPSAAVMHFAEDQGVAIKAPAPAPAPRKPSAASPGTAAAPAARPASRVPSMGPALPDGSFGLGGSDKTTAAAPSPPPPLTAAPPAAAPEPPRKRVLTPEQQLAEAQLKASMK